MSARSMHALSSQRAREAFFAVVGRHLDALHHVVRHHLAYHEAVGDLAPGEVSVEDAVDTVLVRAYQDFVKAPPSGSMRRWLITRAREHLATLARRSRVERARTVHTEDDIPETPPTEWVSTLGDEILDFYEPDEDLKLEDVIPDLGVTTPEREAETRELQSCVSVAMAAMPQEWRRAVLRHYADGLDGEELAKALGRSGADARRLVDHAREFLRQRLVDAGCAVA